jgi:hypothetical protein
MGDSVAFARVQVPGCCLWKLRVRGKSLASFAEDVLASIAEDVLASTAKDVLAAIAEDVLVNFDCLVDMEV